MQLFNPERLPGIKDVPGLAEYGQGLVKAYAQYVLPSFESSEDLQPGDGAVVQKVGGGFQGFGMVLGPRAGLGLRLVGGVGFCGWGRVSGPQAGLGLRPAISSAHERSGSGVRCWPVEQQHKRAAAQSMRSAQCIS